MDIRSTKSQGISDEDIWDIIKKEQRLLITTGKGFAQKRFQNHGSIIIVKLKKPNRLKLETHKPELMAHFLKEDVEWGLHGKG